MPESPYDRVLALAAQVRTMRGHYLDISCGCGARRVVGLGRMALDSRMANATLAHVALCISCVGCNNGPDEVYLCATIYGRVEPLFGGGLVWTMPLVERGRQPSYHFRNAEGAAEARAGSGG